MRAASAIAISAGILAIAVAFAVHDSVRAEVVDPTAATSITVGSGAADRGVARDGRITSLPKTPKVKWSQKLDAIGFAPVVDGKGVVVLVGTGSDPSVIELGAQDGVSRVSKLSKAENDAIASAPIVLANGTRVVVTVSGTVMGVSPGGALAFRTKIQSDVASVGKAGAVPLPSGGFVVARRTDLVELDAHGAIVDRTKLELATGLAVRANGEVVGLAPGAELWAWRAGKVARLLGTFGDKGSAAPHCLGEGISIDTRSKGERAVCVSERRVETLDLGTGQKTALLDVDATPGKRPFRTPAALSASGDLATVLAGGALYGFSAQGTDLGPYEVPGAAILATGKDGGVMYPSVLGETAPLVATDGAIAWGSGDGIAIERGGMVTKVTRCGGYLGSSSAWLATAGPGTLVVACPEGKVELWVDSP
ncbi:MAG: hypothetical protein ACXVEF_26400 [Polyangiales bacterium]